MAGLILAAAILSADVAQALDPQDKQCRVVHYAADGTRHDIPPSRPYVRPPAVAASARSSGEGEARSSTSVSASSSGSGKASAVVRTQSGGRAITKTYDNKGCTVVVDDRQVRGERP